MIQRISQLNRKEIFGAVFVLVFFIVAGYVSEVYQAQLDSLISFGGFLGMLAYVFITIIAVVIAPVSTLPLLPLAVALWGTVQGALLSILGWTIGGVIAYRLAQMYGRSFVGKVINMEKAQNISLVVTGKNPFWAVVFLRMVVPVDILSYALGLFVTMSIPSYTLATLIGVTPFAFVFAYASSLPLPYQIGVVLLASIIAVLGYMRIRNTPVDLSNRGE